MQMHRGQHPRAWSIWWVVLQDHWYILINHKQMMRLVRGQGPGRSRYKGLGFCKLQETQEFKSFRQGSDVTTLRVRAEEGALTISMPTAFLLKLEL